MTSNRRLLVIAFSLALGLGVWAASFSYQAATFSDGDVLSAAVLNALLNDNFQAAADAVTTLEAEVAGIELALDEKYDASGGLIAGQVSIIANDDNPVLAVKQQGTGPVLQLISGVGGTLIEAIDGGDTTFTLASNGTITNAVGSGLPLAYGRVSGGSRAPSASTTNWTVTSDTDVGGTRYLIAIDDVAFDLVSYTAVVTTSGIANQARFATYSALAGGDMIVRVWDASGARVSGDFSFIVFRPGS